MDINNLNQQWETPISQLTQSNFPPQLQRNPQNEISALSNRNPFAENQNQPQFIPQNIQEINNELDKLENNNQSIIFKYFKLFILIFIIYLFFSADFVKKNVGNIVPAINPTNGIIPFYGYIAYGIMYCLVVVVTIAITSKYNML